MSFTYFREIDRLGRVVIPMDIRKSMSINAGDVLKIKADDNKITIKKAIDKCIFCGNEETLKKFEGKSVCESCIEKLGKTD